MTQEDKQLILKDLSARLPYRVKCSFRYSVKSKILREDNNFELTPTLYDIFTCKREDEDYIKPYLRPMSSMTDEEYKEAKTNGCIIYRDTSPEDKGLMVIASQKGIDWLNAHHFDIRNLIEKGLALEAPKGMYN